MTLSKEHVKLIKTIIKDKVHNKPVPRSTIWKLFEKQAKTGMERYRFEKELSELVRKRVFPEYEMKTGCKGGLVKRLPKERIILQVNGEKYVGAVSRPVLQNFLSAVDVEKLTVDIKQNKE